MPVGMPSSLQTSSTATSGSQAGGGTGNVSFKSGFSLGDIPKPVWYIAGTLAFVWLLRRKS